MLSSSLGMTVSTRPLAMLADALCHRRTGLDVGRQALLVVGLGDLRDVVVTVNALHCQRNHVFRDVSW